MSQALTIAIPKGRLMESVQDFLSNCGMDISFENRKFATMDSTGMLEVYKVKNHDLPTYVHHGITGLGIVGDDIVAESGFNFAQIFTFPFGQTQLCLASSADALHPDQCSSQITVATSYTRMTRDWLHQRGIPVKTIHLSGSVELAPALGLTPYVVDLVETGSTLKANGLVILDTLKDIRVRLIANLAYFKLNYKRIQKLTDILKGNHNDRD